MYYILNFLYYNFRYKLPIVIIVVNNNGIYGGVDESTWSLVQDSANLTEVYVYNIICYKLIICSLLLAIFNF